ncbi:protein hunchback [Drosophila subpulchrella]|uniref:protein hunchback n=1 Tax=Drosophila subpulchrella TaxID=1486046 RepID=UPI0018A167B7|nr:protein hunchback [Drosophila subpulchrella]
MQNWETTATTNYEQHNAWYSSMFAANIKQEPGHHLDGNSVASSPRQSPIPSTNHLEQFLKQQQHQQQPMDTLCAMTPSPSQNDQNSLQHYDANLQQQLLQQQQYQQHFQAAQQQHHHHHHLIGGFNPLTPPGLPNPMQHFYGGNLRPSPQPTPTSASTVAPVAVATGSSSTSEKLQALTPPMDVTPPKSPAKSSQSNQEPEKEHDQMSNSSEDMKYMAESEDDDTNIRMPIYNSHGKMKNYKCKTCGVVAITKVDFWAHTRTHMKPDKILQCPKCPFVTEFKHHLEYHIRKHKNQKPFQCDKCSYTCVNKSMLNSHRKSHSSVYQYRCADCDYATKYCHSFKLHLRKYGHKPGMVLDEDGTPNPSLVIDVYGTRRGPKSKNGGPIAGGGSGSGSRKSNVAAVAPQQQQPSQPIQPATSQLSAALQGFPLVQSNSAPAAASPVLPLPASPAKSVASVDQTPSLPSPANLLPPLASLLQQNRNMAFFPYWNLNLQMLAAQQQAAVLAQLSPRMREQLQQQNQQQSDNEEEEQDDEYERKSVDSAMDLSQGTPVKEDEQQHQPQQQQPLAMNLKVEEEATPLMSSSNASRRKGRVLKLDTLLQLRSEAMTSPEQLKVPSSSSMPTASSPIAGRKPMPEEHCSGTSSADESMETANVPQANTSASSTASSSGNSSNASSNSNANSSSNSSSNGTTSAVAAPPSGTPAAAGAIYECKYCDIFFKDAVLYTIHMGYHSCDDVFKCNMCGEKCDGPVGLFVHMARNAHS